MVCSARRNPAKDGAVANAIISNYDRSYATSYAMNLKGVLRAQVVDNRPIHDI